MLIFYAIYISMMLIIFNNFSKVESFVWDKLIEKNYEWIPIDVNAARDDEEDD